MGKSPTVHFGIILLHFLSQNLNQKMNYFLIRQNLFLGVILLLCETESRGLWECFSAQLMLTAVCCLVKVLSAELLLVITFSF